MDPRSDIREFLVSRRAKITPEQAGLPIYGTRRRVVGLRREEVAMLAGISAEYYTRLERGTATGASQEVLEGIARALQLDEAERSHLFDLMRPPNRLGPPPERTASEKVRPAVLQILDSMAEVPAYVRNGRLDILAANALGHAIYAPVFASTNGVPNIARFLFTSPQASEFFPNWTSAASDAVGILRAQAGRSPNDRRLADLVGELSMRSEGFRTRWAAHNVKFHQTGTKSLHHPIVGDLVLHYEALDLPGDDGQRILLYLAEPGSPSFEALKLLSSWTASSQGSYARPLTDKEDR